MTLSGIAESGDEIANRLPRTTARPQIPDVSWVGGTVIPKPRLPGPGQIVEGFTAPPPNVHLAPTVIAAVEEAWRRHSVSPIRIIKRTEPTQDRFHALQQWEGVVDTIKNATFVAVLVDRTTEGPDEEVEFDISEVASGDRNLIAPGAVFYWSVGYRTSATGVRFRASVISFRRLPAWTEKERQQARERAQDIARTLDWR
jgi:hypothetical protein